MAGDFLRSKGIDIDAEMAKIQNTSVSDGPQTAFERLLIKNVALPSRSESQTWNLLLKDGLVERIEETTDATSLDIEHFSSIDGHGALLAPSLCHPHIHIDKAFLLSHPKFSHLQVEKGDFQEAMSLTGQAKSNFEHADLMERGQRVVDESVSAGVTHMRAFVEVDAGVNTKCLDAGIELKQKAAEAETCNVQLCAFAQLPLFSSATGDEDGSVIRALVQSAAASPDVDVIGSTPYVESDRDRMKHNVEWMVDLSIEHDLHLDFHLDYNLDPDSEPLVWHVIQTLKNRDWKSRTNDRTVVLGHCTRLALFTAEEWQRLAATIKEADLPISFVGLPTSDLFMMRTGRKPEIRGTLDVPTLINQWGLNACIGVNNIGNAFTPQGSCDPLGLACQGVGIYQAGRKKDTELLFECVSTRAKAAIGVGGSGGRDAALQIRAGDVADLLLFPGSTQTKKQWRSSKSVSAAVYLYDHCQGRRGILGGKLVKRAPN